MSFKKLLDKGRVVCLCTASKNGKPNAIFAESWLFKNKVLIVDCHMKKTVKNLKENNQVSLIAQNCKEYYQIKGIAEYCIKGKWLEKARQIVKGTKYKAKGTVVISIKEVYDLDSRKKLL